jgi:hypothetical protein
VAGPTHNYDDEDIRRVFERSLEAGRTRVQIFGNRCGRCLKRGGLLSICGCAVKSTTDPGALPDINKAYS